MTPTRTQGRWFHAPKFTQPQCYELRFRGRFWGKVQREDDVTSAFHTRWLAWASGVFVGNFATQAEARRAVREYLEQPS